MEDQQAKDLVNKYFDTALDHRRFLEEYRWQFENSFLQVKVAFTGILGIAWTIAFANFSNEASTTPLLKKLGIVTLSAFLLLIVELWRRAVDAERQIKDQGEKIILAQVARIALDQKEFANYGLASTTEMWRRDKLSHALIGAMKDKKSLREILQGNSGVEFSSFVSLALWTILLISFVIVLNSALHFSPF